MAKTDPYYDEYARRLMRNPVPVHQGFLRLRISELPVNYQERRTSVTEPYTTDAQETINANIKDWVCPGLSCSLAKEGHYKFVTRIPTQEDNQYDDTITVNMLADNRWENYWAINRYMEVVQSGQTDADPVRDVRHRIYGIDHRYRNRLTYIQWIDMHFADDVAQEYMVVRLERCRFAALSAMSLKPGTIEPASFNLTINYEIRRIIRMPDPNELMNAICIAEGADSYY
jgi:hypothetical protein